MSKRYVSLPVGTFGKASALHGVLENVIEQLSPRTDCRMNTRLIGLALAMNPMAMTTIDRPSCGFYDTHDLPVMNVSVKKNVNIDSGTIDGTTEADIHNYLTCEAIKVIMDDVKWYIRSCRKEDKALASRYLGRCIGKLLCETYTAKEFFDGMKGCIEQHRSYSGVPPCVFFDSEKPVSALKAVANAATSYVKKNVESSRWGYTKSDKINELRECIKACNAELVAKLMELEGEYDE